MIGLIERLVMALNDDGVFEVHFSHKEAQKHRISGTHF
jgi:hypothetical protein